MSRKSFIVNLFTLGVLLSVSKICDSEKSRESVATKYRQVLDSSVISGIRNLEYVRRRIIDSSRDERNIDSLFSTIDNKQQDYPRYFDDLPRRGEKIRETLHPRRQIDSTTYEALAKLANIRVDDRNIEDQASRGFRDDNSEIQLTRRKFNDSTMVTDQERNEEWHKNPDIERNPMKNELSTTEASTIFNKTQLITRKFQCRSISEIYIPRVDKKMPAYLCTLGKRAFVVSSDRFNQESRDSFFVSLDDKTFRRLTPMNSGTTSLTSAVSVLPATLVLKRGDNGYAVRGVKDDSTSVQSTDSPETYF